MAGGELLLNRDTSLEAEQNNYYMPPQTENCGCLLHQLDFSTIKYGPECHTNLKQLVISSQRVKYTFYSSVQFYKWHQKQKSIWNLGACRHLKYASCNSNRVEISSEAWIPAFIRIPVEFALMTGANLPQMFCIKEVARQIITLARCAWTVNGGAMFDSLPLLRFFSRLSVRMWLGKNSVTVSNSSQTADAILVCISWSFIYWQLRF